MYIDSGHHLAHFGMLAGCMLLESHIWMGLTNMQMVQILQQDSVVIKAFEIDFEVPVNLTNLAMFTYVERSLPCF